MQNKGPVPPMIYLIRALAGESPVMCTFIKRGDGDQRVMRCVLRGPDSDDYDHKLLAVYDLQKNADRRIPVDAILTIKLGDVVFTPEVHGNYLKVSDLQRIAGIKWKTQWRHSFLKPIT